MSEDNKILKAKKLLEQVMANYQAAASIAEQEGYETNYEQDKVLTDFLLNELTQK